MTRRIIIEITTFLLILLFVYAAVSKVLDYQKFTVQIGQSPLLTRFAAVIPSLVILSEFLTSALLVFPRLRLVGFYAAFCLMTMFTGYIVAILNFSDYVPCSCGGVLEKLGWTEHLILNAAFTLLSLTGIVLLAYNKSKNPVTALS